jgi:chitin disaccharide deacetylase
VQIILNADDFGASPDTVSATVACFERGALTSATIMPNMPATAEALEYARVRPDYSFGVHLTLTGNGSERPLTPAASVARLVDSSGRLLPARDVRLRALLGRLSLDEIEREIAAQIAFVAEHGVSVSHVDSHRHLHKLGPFREALRSVLPQFGIERVRAVQDVWLRRPIGSATLWLGRSWRRAVAASFSTTDHFYMPSSANDLDWEEGLLATVRRLPGRTLEIGVHPGSLDAWRSEEQRSLLLFAEAASGDGHELVSWSAIR